MAVGAWFVTAGASETPKLACDYMVTGSFMDVATEATAKTPREAVDEFFATSQKELSSELADAVPSSEEVAAATEATPGVYFVKSGGQYSVEIHVAATPDGRWYPSGISYCSKGPSGA